MTTIGASPSSSDFFRTYLVCGIGPSTASTSRRAPSTILRMRSTSPPKSEWPGVSTMFIFTPFHFTEAFFEKMVMPRSRSRSLESRTRSPIRSFSRKVPAWRKSVSTSVVFPWSTWAITHTFLMSCRFIGKQKSVSALTGRIKRRSVEYFHLFVKYGVKNPLNSAIVSATSTFGNFFSLSTFSKSIGRG